MIWRNAPHFKFHLLVIFCDVTSLSEVMKTAICLLSQRKSLKSFSKCLSTFPRHQCPGAKVCHSENDLRSAICDLWRTVKCHEIKVHPGLGFYVHFGVFILAIRSIVCIHCVQVGTTPINGWLEITEIYCGLSNDRYLAKKC